MKGNKKSIIKQAKKANNIAKSKLRKERRNKLKEKSLLIVKNENVQKKDKIPKKIEKEASEEEESESSDSDSSTESTAMIEEESPKMRGNVLMFGGTAQLDAKATESVKPTNLKSKKSKITNKQENDEKESDAMNTEESPKMTNETEEAAAVISKKEKLKKKKLNKKLSKITNKQEKSEDGSNTMDTVELPKLTNGSEQTAVTSKKEKLKKKKLNKKDVDSNIPNKQKSDSKQNDEFLNEWNRVKDYYLEQIKEKKLTGKKKKKYLSVQRKKIFMKITSMKNSMK